MNETLLLNVQKKELRYLSALSTVLDMDVAVEDLCRAILAIIPGAWQFCEITCARIAFADKDFTTENFNETSWKLTSHIFVHGLPYGSIDVCYREEKPPLDEGPFLMEERKLLDAFANRLGKTIEQRRVEEDLRQTKDYLENLLNYANAPVIVWDDDYRITIFNHAFERLTGLLACEVTGKPLQMLFPCESLSRIMELIGRAMTGERWETVDIPILCKDGAVRTVLWNSATIRDPRSGKSVATIAQGQDITERQKMEESLRESEFRFRLIAENVNDGFSIYDVDNTTHVYVNKIFSASGRSPKSRGGVSQQGSRLPRIPYDARRWPHPLAAPQKFSDQG
jgi:PAS domain S-box-containing protein